jgi:RNA polymerase sigma-70 factor (ECF subfamily)
VEHAEDPRPAIDPAALLAEATWVDRLARGLVRDDAAARDLVQETWLAALRAPPVADGRLRPWLARVLLNFARQKKRGDLRRASREAIAARPERQPPVSEAAERVEAQRALAEALSVLEEPLKSTVVLRFFDGLSPSEIAKRQGVPAGTVRWRLHRALDELRERLGRGFDGGPSGSWALVLLPLLKRPPLAEIAAGSAAAVVQGVIMTNGILKLGIAAAVVGAASLGVWYANDRSPTPLAPAVANEPAATPASLEPPPPGDQRLVSAAPEAARASAAVAPAPTAHAAVDPAEPAHPSITVVEARFLDEQEHPVEGVRLALTSLGTGHAAGSDDPATVSSPPVVLSGADGRARVEVNIGQQPTSAAVQATHDGLATHFSNAALEPGKTEYLGDIHLAPGGSVAGFVLDEKGAPVRGAQVQVVSPEMTRDVEESRRLGPYSSESHPVGTTHADGSFRIDGVHLKPVRVWAGTDDTRWSYTEPIDLAANSLRSDVELRLQPLQPIDLISGVVLAPDGNAVPGAEVRYVGRIRGSTYSGSFKTGKDGRFRHRVQVEGSHDFHARDDKSRWPDAAALAVEPGTLDLVLQFPTPRWIEISVHNTDGGSIEEFSASVESSDRQHTIVPASIETHAKGRVAILVPAEPFVVEVRARGHGNALLGPWSPDAAPASESCKLETLPGVRGQVRANGEPVANAKVSLHEIADATTQIVQNGFLMRLHPSPEDTTTTDPQGFFQLDPSRPGDKDTDRFFQRDARTPRSFAILCEAEGWSIAELSPLDIDPATGVDGLKIDLLRGGTIEGKVLVAPGREPAGTVIGLNRHDGKPRTQRVGPDGTYRFDHLTPGKYLVQRVDEELRAGSSSTSWSSGDSIRADYKTNCSVDDGRTTRLDVDLRDDAPCMLVAKVRVNGEAATGWTASVEGEDRNHTQQTPGGGVDSKGELKVEVREPGKYVLSLLPPDAGEVYFELPLELHRGENAMPVELSIGAVRGTCAAPAAESILNFATASPGGIVCHVSAKIGAEGKFEMPYVLAGPGFVTRSDFHPDGSIVGPVAKTAVDVPVGGTADAVVP